MSRWKHALASAMVAVASLGAPVCDEPDARVVVIGAGSAGLTVCAALTAHGCNCTVLEASDRVGGRMRTLDGAFDGLDAGAHWVHGGRDASQPVRRWLDAQQPV